MPTPEFAGASGLNDYADFVMQTDHEVGRVLQALDQSGLAENTLVIMTSDNGAPPQADFDLLLKKGHDPSAGLRGAKFYAYEGGHRVPFLVRWPARVEAGSASGELVSLVDWMRTLAELTGRQLPDDAGEDSFSFLHLLVNEPPRSAVRKSVVAASFHGHLSLRNATWYYLPSKWDGGDDTPNRYPRHEQYPDSYETFQLYNLRTDPAQTTNVYEAHPEVVEAAEARLTEILVNGRQTPGPPQPNFQGQNWWEEITWMEKDEVPENP
jgi:arylsulfatase A-like enzyme